MTDPPPADDTPETVGRETWIAVAAMAMAVFAIANDFTAMNVVLPSIESELDTDLASVQWVVNGYALIFGVLIVPGGRLADIFGRQRILYIGATIFLGFSFLGGLAPNIELLVASRCLMGVGGAMMWPAILGLMYAILPPSKAGLAGGLVIGVAGIGNAAGPVIAGALAEISWRWIFFLNVPIALIAIVVTWRAVHVPNPDEREPIDYWGSALLSLGLGALLGALTIAPNDGWTEPVVLALFGGCVVMLIAFVFRERAAGESGLVPPSVIENRPFVAACIAVLLMSSTFFATLLYLPQFFEKILDDSTLTAGVLLLPFVGTFALASFAETWLLNRVGMKAVITVGAACIFVGPVLFVALFDQDAGLGRLVPGMVVLGIGVGLFYSSVTTAALTALDPSKSSLAGGILYMFQVAGGAVGLGLTTAIFLVAANGEIETGAQEVGVTLTSSEVHDIQGVLAGTDSSEQVVAGHADQAAELTQVVRDSFVSGVRWAFTWDALLAGVGLVIAALAVGGPLRRFGRDVGDTAAGAETEAEAEPGEPSRVVFDPRAGAAMTDESGRPHRHWIRRHTHRHASP